MGEVHPILDDGNQEKLEPRAVTEWHCEKKALTPKIWWYLVSNLIFSSLSSYFVSFLKFIFALLNLIYLLCLKIVCCQVYQNGFLWKVEEKEQKV